MSFYITTDSGADISQKFIDTFRVNNFIIIQMPVIQENIEYDGVNKILDVKEFYSKMRSGIQAQTSLINTYNTIEFLKPLLEKGYDILHIAFSSGLSGTAKCAEKAIEELRIIYPERKIYFVDSLCASLGQGLLVYYLIKAREENKTIEECYKLAMDLKGHVCHYFMVDDLKHLLRTGRTTRLEAFIGKTLKIKPFLYANKYGKLVPIEKGVSRKKTISLIVNKMIENIKSFDDNPIIFISHGDAEDSAKYAIDEIKKLTPIKDFFVDIISPVIASHSGPGTLAIFYIGKSRIYPKDKTIN